MNQKLTNEVIMAIKNTSFSIPESDLADLKKIAEKNNRSVSNLIVTLIKEAIAKDKGARK